MPLPSDPAKASSESSTPWLAPMAISRRRISSSSSPPTVTTVTLPPARATICSASSTA